MSETRHRPRKATRKAGAPEANEAAAPVFQAPEQPEQTEAPAEKPAEENQGGQDKPKSGNGRRRGGEKNGHGGGKNGKNKRGGRGHGAKSKRGGRGGKNRDRGSRPADSFSAGRDLLEKLPKPGKQKEGSLRIYALGGISEIGRNMTVFEYDGRLLIVDCGVLFPTSAEPGVDLLLPDFGPIEQRLDDVDALVITHGHEDHIGAIPWLLKLRPDIPIVASRFTAALIVAKCQEHQQRPKIVEVDEESNIDRGPFNVRFWHVNHSVPGCLGLAIKTGAGLVIHTGDIKVDQTPLDGQPTDLPKLSRFGDEGVDLLLIDSTNAVTPGVSPSEADIAPTLKRLIKDAKQRVLVASFASNVSRVQAAVDAAVEAGRKVAFNGRSMIRNMEIAQKLGYLTAPKGTIVEMDEASRLAPHKVLLVTTGTQGEPMAALSRMSRGEHRQITIQDGDRIILSSSLVPGNEEAVFTVTNALARIGAEVITSKDAKVHTSGHGYSGELLFLYNAARPRNAMPVHGEWAHLLANRQLALRTGVPEERTVIAQNGVVVDLVDGRVKIAGQLPTGNLFVDGVTMGEVDDDVLEERTTLGDGGVVSISAVINKATGRLIEPPTVITRGFATDDRRYVGELRSLVEKTIADQAANGVTEPAPLSRALRNKVGRLAEKKWRREPLVIAGIVPVAEAN